MQAVLALQWLSKMHAACWGAPPSGVWPKVSVNHTEPVLYYISSRLLTAAHCSCNYIRVLPAPKLASDRKEGAWGFLGDSQARRGGAFPSVETPLWQALCILHLGFIHRFQIYDLVSKKKNCKQYKVFNM